MERLKGGEAVDRKIRLWCSKTESSIGVKGWRVVGWSSRRAEKV